MSVWTSYRFSSETENIIAMLKESGVMDDNYKLDLSKACPDWWEEDFARIKERGVINCSGQIPSLDSVLLRNRIPNTTDAPEIKDAETKGYVLSHFSLKDGRYGAYMYTDRKHSSEKVFVPLSKENSDNAIAYAENIRNMYSPCSDGHGYRRDYTDYELSLMPLVSLHVSTDGILSYGANYATAFDDNVAGYISKALPTTKIHLVQCTECDLDFDGYLLNGECV